MIREFKNYIALFLFFIGVFIINYWTNSMLKEQIQMVKIVGQVGINVPLFCIFFSNKFYKLKEKENRKHDKLRKM